MIYWYRALGYANPLLTNPLWRLVSFKEEKPYQK